MTEEFKIKAIKNACNNPYNAWPNLPIGKTLKEKKWDEVKKNYPSEDENSRFVSKT